ncbi:leucine rich repeat protein [Ichthyophthirius multifiliis]|uniref:Leucine rich repeat protein n=1 Tax=Ichthyophthirius multifiliis TaxID=5932 RepID=G0R576_ICHMU|nr:leucine rich repeat protein [Ichthyophthirius multifiliis]EGR27400.1 leucine rich repeat protein [Ichthyophthirius multifiliis]|eukprot:XP_004024284.1 leucine rich repeat protein [Ichthyophthirius multifiliis]
MEIGQALTYNNSIKILDLSGCNLSSFLLSYILKRLINNKTIQELNISNNYNINQEVIEDLIQFLDYSKQQKNCLKILNLAHCNIQIMQQAFVLAALQNAQYLTHLNMSFMKFEAFSLMCLANGLKNNKSLQEINISYNQIKESGLKVFIQAFGSFFWGVSNIKSINFAGNKMNNTKLIGQLLRIFNKCKSVNLSYNNLNRIDDFYNPQINKSLETLILQGNFIKMIPTINMFENLTQLDLSNNKIGFKGANTIAQYLKTNPKWISLNLDVNFIKSEGFNVIIHALRDNKTLQKLSIAYNNLDGESIICMIVNHDALSIQYLDITGNAIHYSIVFVLLKLMNNCKLRVIKFCNLVNDIKGEGQHESKFTINSEFLQELDFSGNQLISCAVVYSLQARFNKLEILNLKGCSPFHDQDLVNLGNFVKRNDYLRQLNLRELKIGKLSLKSIESFVSVLKQNFSLQNINLSKNKLAIDDEKLAQILINLGECSNLETLDLSQNGITQKHSKYLQQMLISSKNLKTLSLSNNFISLENLLCLKFEDQWQLYLKKKNEEKDISKNKKKLLKKQFYDNANELLKLKIRFLNLDNLCLKSDDLRVLGYSLNENEIIQEVNMQNNKHFNIVNSEFYKQQSEGFECIKYSFQFFRKQNFHSSISHNKQYLQQLIIKNCLFSQQSILNFYSALENLQKSNNLKVLDIDSLLTLQELLPELLAIIGKISTIQILKLKNLLITDKFCQNLMVFLQSSQNLKLLDISNNQFKQNQFEFIIQGIGNNQSVNNYIMQNIKIPQNCFQNLFICLQQNQRIKLLDFSNNFLDQEQLLCLAQMVKQSQKTKFLILQMQKMVNDSDFSNTLQKRSEINKDITEQQQEINIRFQNKTRFYIQLQAFQQFIQIIFQSHSLRHLDLSNCGLTSFHLKIIVDELTTKQTLIKSFNIPNNKIDKQCAIYIKQLLVQSKYIKELNIKNCEIKIDAYQEICQAQKDILNNLQFLFLNKNNISKIGNQQLKKVYENNHQIFIINEWNQVDNILANYIIQSYVNVFEKYSFLQNLVPRYLRKISIIKSYLDDDFCISFAKKLYNFKFLQEIDLSENPYISSIGKIFLFMHLFDIRCDNQTLKSLQIINTDNNSYEQINIVDEGIIQYFSRKSSDNFQIKSIFQNIFTKILSQNNIISSKYQMNCTFNKNAEKGTFSYVYIYFLIIHFVQNFQTHIPFYYIFISEHQSELQFDVVFYSVLVINFLLCIFELVFVCKKIQKLKEKLNKIKNQKKKFKKYKKRPRKEKQCFIILR